MTTAYVNTLRDPFECPAVRLGWGTFVPSSLFMAYARGNFATNADGSFALVLSPTLNSTGNALYTNLSGAAGTTWSGVPYSNAAAITAASTAGRIVSGGVRIIPQVPATQAPGVIYAGSIPSASYNEIVTGQSVNALITSPCLDIGRGSSGASAMMRPIDPSSFIFNQLVLNGYPTGTSYDMSVPVICGTGFPANTQVWYECILNLETTLGVSTASQLYTNPEIRMIDQPTVASEHTNVESMWSRIINLMPTSSSIDAASSIMTGFLTTGARISLAYQQHRASMARYGRGAGGRMQYALE
jgi:hypothetical protein